MKNNGLTIIDEEKEIFVGAVDGERFDRLFKTMKQMDAEYTLKILNKKCPYCSKERDLNQRSNK